MTAKNFLVLFFLIGLACLAINKVKEFQSKNPPIYSAPPSAHRMAAITPHSSPQPLEVLSDIPVPITPVFWGKPASETPIDPGVPLEEPPEFEDIMVIENARITVYWGGDRWTNKGIGCFGDKLEHKKSAAVDFRLDYFERGTTIIIPKAKMKLTAIDTGGAVKRKTADYRYGKKKPVIDIYFTNRKEALAWSRKHGDYMDVLVIRG